jgi:hypothetical protein
VLRVVRSIHRAAHPILERSAMRLLIIVDTSVYQAYARAVCLRSTSLSGEHVA